MKKLMCVAAILVFLVGCDVTNPDSKAQKIAQDVNEAAQVASDVLDVVPVPSPLRETLLGVVALVGAAAGAVQSVRKKRSDSTLSQVVRGVDDAIKAGAITPSKEFSASMNGAQDSVTRKVVDKLQGK